MGAVRQEQTLETPLTRVEPVSTQDSGRPTGLLIAIALGIVYVVWGSTYLAIRVMVEDLPPLSSAGWRFGTAGILLTLVLVLRSGVRRMRVTRTELLASAFMGLMLPVLGNGLVSVGEHHGAASGLAALIVAAVPLWIIVYRRLSGDRPGLRTTGGVMLGFVGLAALVTATGVGGDVEVLPLLVIVFATVCWAFGSWSTSWLTLPKDAFVMTAYEMLFGGVFLVLGGLVSGEDVIPQSAPLDSWLAWVYLVVFGSLVAFTSYVWLLSVAPISLVATYAYVNPIVAVFLGWLILAEPVTTAIVACGAVVVVAVAIVVAAERRPAAERRTVTTAEASEA